MGKEYTALLLKFVKRLAHTCPRLVNRRFSRWAAALGTLRKSGWRIRGWVCSSTLRGHGEVDTYTSLTGRPSVSLVGGGVRSCSKVGSDE